MKALCGGALFVAAWLACGGVGIHAEEPERFEVSLHVHVDPAISRLVTGVFEDETAAIWRPYGVRLEWADTGAFRPGAHGWSLDVILQPKIEGATLPQWSAVLGTASVDLDAPTRRPIRVSFDATESVLALGRSGPSTRSFHDRQMARALGRVLAHEIGHVLLGAPYHDDVGLMRAMFHPDELADQDRTPFRL